MMMIYGMFVFQLSTLPHQQVEQSKRWRHVSNERVNRSSSWQYIGSGEDHITMSGVLCPEITGGEVSLTALNTLAYTGLPWPLIDGVGQITGCMSLRKSGSPVRSWIATAWPVKLSSLSAFSDAMKICVSVFSRARWVI